jgi:hypothetical protein
MPRPSLRHAQEPVRAFCAQHGIAYRDSGFFASYAEVLRHLRTAGSPRPESSTERAGLRAALRSPDPARLTVGPPAQVCHCGGAMKSELGGGAHGRT